MKKRNAKQTRSGREANAAEGSPLASLKGFKEGLFQPVDALPLGIFRFLFGLLLAFEFFFVSRETFPADYIRPLFHFTYPLFDLLGLRPLSESYLRVLFHVMQISTIGIMLGLFTRASLVTFTVLFGYFFFMESSVYTNHYYLIFLLSFLLCLGHSGSAFSCDSYLWRKTRRETVCYWEFFLLRFQICAVFLFGGLAKLNSDWLIYAAPLYLNFIKHFSFLGYPLQEKWIAVVLSWTGMFSDLGIGLLLVLNRWHKSVFVWLCLFNGANVVFFGWGIKTFPYMMVATYILFVPSSRVRQFTSRSGRWIPLMQTIESVKRPTALKKDARARSAPWIYGFVLLYVTFQILMPLRHYVYKRDLRWTHEGSNFSWRMMADHHETNGGITIEDPRTGEIYAHSPEQLLTRKQLVMVNTPYLLLQYVRFLKQYLRQETKIVDPIIKADVQVSVNGMPFQPMYDPTANLSEVDYSPFEDLKWIIPLKEN